MRQSRNNLFHSFLETIFTPCRETVGAYPFSVGAVVFDYMMNPLFTAERAETRFAVTAIAWSIPVTVWHC